MFVPRRLLVAGLVLSAPARAARPRVGEVVSITPEARALFSGEPTRRLAAQDPVLLADMLTTDVGARLACRLEGGLLMQLGERASLQIDALTLRGPRPGTAIRVFEGPMLLDRAPGSSRTPIEVALPWARIGVRGTRFFAGPLGGVNAVFVARGMVEVRAGGASVLLGEGEGVDVAATPGPVVRWGAARIARAMALVD